MKKHFLKVVTLFSAISLAGANIGHPVHGEKVTKSGVVMKPISSLQDRQVEDEKKPLLSDEILVVKYKTPLTQSELQRSGLVLMKNMPSLNTAVLKLKNKKKMNEVIQEFSRKGHIESIQPSALFKTLGAGDPKADKQYYLQMLQIPKAQTLAGKGKVRVAVIDQGIDMNHPELKGKLLPGFNAVNPMSAAKPDFHGTHVAGIIASGKNNGIGGYGINPNVEILPIDVFDRMWGASDYSIAQGILYAIEKKAKVINLSLGGPYPSQVMKDAIKKAVDQGIVVVAAAGNSGNDMLNYPASYEGVISVGNIDNKKKLAYDSSYGPAIDIVAPGTDIYNTLYEYEKKSSFREMSGTSMASPMVAGVASLLLSKYPSLKPAEIEYILKHTADDLGKKGYDVKFGSGLVNPVKALSFDVKKIPSYIKNGKIERDQLIGKALLIDPKTQEVISNVLTKPQQENWIKVDVKAGQTLQLQLQGAEHFDYKILGKWLDSKEEFEINEVGHGKMEGSLIPIEKDGTLAIGIKDVHGQYDEKGSKSSYYYLNLSLVDEVPVDELTFDQPAIISSFPASMKHETLYAPNGEVDDDFYEFKVTEPQLVKISLSDLPGVDSSISLYMKEMFNTEVPSEEQGAVMPVPPIKYENKKGKSEGEVLVFPAEPDIEYMVKVSNQSEPFFDFFSFFMDPSLMDNQTKPASSLDRYELSFEGIVLPEDEDQFTLQDFYNAMDEGNSNGMPVFNYYEREQKLTDMIKEIAVPIESESVSGFLQMEGDQDWYQIKAEADGVYKLDLKQGALKPSVDVYQLVKEKVKEDEYEFLSSIGYNFDWWAFDLKDELYLSLEKDRSYFIKLEPSFINYSGVSIDPYQFQLTKVADIKKDAYEPNDVFEEAKDLKSATITSTFSKANDTDIYYFKAKESEIYSISLKPGELTAQLKAAYPENVLQPYYSFMAIYEDTNKNRKLDEKEMESVHYIENNIYGEKTFGSFKTKKNANYFLATFSYSDSNERFSLRPYHLTVKPVPKKDEDPQNNGVSISKVKPVKMKQKGSNEFVSEGYFHAGMGYGDEDWYSFTVKKKGDVTITMSIPPELDGQIELYQNGKLIRSADYYPEGDNEVLQVNLNQGEYWIKLKESLNQTSLDPYKLTVKTAK